MVSRGKSAFLVGIALAIAAGTAAAHAQGPSRGARPIVVIIEGLRNSHGFVQGALFTSAESWLREGFSAEDCHASIRGGSARCEFSTVPPGRVAFAALHDEDGDGQFDRNFLGIPEEGYAFSNDVREPFGPPSFAAAAFMPSRRPFVVHARYGL